MWDDPPSQAQTKAQGHSSPLHNCIEFELLGAECNSLQEPNDGVLVRGDNPCGKFSNILPPRHKRLHKFLAEILSIICQIQDYREYLW
ncbi:hypothetical protein PHYBLDRAFT_159176 [Phycomyces blakesleeanus NRRL 1555(-)]|uniref:Uncharacterized protein n=1 Tax=Phycomyces blakesleeanus (strain ATCC 8743b / DSM 1359 / FGSC 10004 / NBRC 33097 / NRRL 1555) TaxID=763407 RepID=A0A167MDW2_PHYB8|nr:hypothetical protein PHYBLDRAFT_159176 [Phycomyces blakesleeanus NRRL 1555(-)]OAD72574.1 hypothetical protein PHYBLDRAFT_159176 [Phycomyces blakesleeanus NRRL 1555(-)]|eukprot:XP_018290614.1 hypothetical protein PHYBLDRAFT_159176 [Phycomyces blakesleeanus NRRL 1555(-)]